MTFEEACAAVKSIAGNRYYSLSGLFTASGLKCRVNIGGTGTDPDRTYEGPTFEECVRAMEPHRINHPTPRCLQPHELADGYLLPESRQLHVLGCEFCRLLLNKPALAGMPENRP